MVAAITNRRNPSRSIKPMMNNAGNNSTSTSVGWLMHFCRCLQDYEWPADQEMTFDGAAFQHDYPEESIQLFFSAVLKSGKGKHMCLKNLTLTPALRRELAKVLAHNQGLESLTLSNVSCCHDDTLESDNVTSSWKSLKCDFLLESGSNLKKLTVERCRIDAIGAKILGEAVAACAVERLKMNHVSLAAEEDCSGLANGLAQAGGSLQSLELCQVPMEEHLLVQMLQALRACTRIETLHLQGCGLGSKQDIPQLAYLIASLQNLHSLNLLQNNVDTDGLEILISRGLDHHRSLQKLVLSGNPIGDDGARHFAALLAGPPGSTCLQTLSISDCDIWPPGCQAVAERLAQFTTLEELNVDDEWKDHLKLLATSLESNMTLRHIWMPQTPTLMHSGDRQWKQVDYYLRLNRAKRRILIVEPKVSRALWPVIMGQSTGDPDVCYHLLQQCPELVEEIMDKESE